MSSSSSNNLYRYEKPLRDLFILPFWLFVFTCVATFSLFSLYRSIQTQIEYASLINQVIAQTATAQNASLTASQVATVLRQSPYIDNIIFYPVGSTQLIPNPIISWQTYLLQDEIDISQPVYLANTAQPSLPENKITGQTNQIIGHLYLSLSLEKIRARWMLRYLALFGIIILLALLLMAICFKRIRPFFIRLSHLEHLSEQIINNKSDELKIKIDPDEDRWVFSLALEQLIDKQSHLINQIKQLLKKSRKLSETQENHAYQHSHFQNVITHELKLSLNQINAGLKLLNSQYASNEQKDAIDIIETGSHKIDDKLNQIIYISRLEKGQIGVSLERFDPIQLLDTVVTSLQPIARDKGLILSQKNHFSSYILEGDTQKITLIITSLIENALKFTEKGTVSISSQLDHLPQKLHWQIAVTDTGIGIGGHHQNLTFQPFFQGNPNHGSQFKEKGVGLYLVKKLLDLIEGEIQVISDVSTGSTFTVIFPLTDWQKNNQYTALRDKKIAIFEPTGEYDTLIQTVKATGAEVQVYQNDKILLNDTLTETYQMLICMPTASPRQVSDITQQIRQHQHNARMLILYHHLPTEKLEKAILLADGVDYIHYLKLSSEDDAINEQGFIKNLIIYLS